MKKLSKSTKAKEHDVERPRKRQRQTDTVQDSTVSGSKDAELVDIDKLEWKQVQLPDRVGDLEGLMGFEEIEGIAVESEYSKDGTEKIVRFKKASVEIEAAKKPAPSKAKLVEQGDDATGSVKSVKENKKARAKKRKSTQSAAVVKDTNTFTGLDPELAEVELPEWSSIYPLSESLLHGLNDLGFSAPTDVQRQAIPFIINGHDVIGKAPTGSGKTLAFGLAILEKYLASGASAASVLSAKKSMTFKTAPSPTALIFAPTRELVHQISDHITKVSKYTPANIVSITGGLAIQKQQRQLGYFPDIVVATPGRLHELLTSDSNGMIGWLAGVEILVLDEADRLLQDGHYKELDEIIDMIRQKSDDDEDSDMELEDGNELQGSKTRKRRNVKRQSMVFSATFNKDLGRKITVAKKNSKNGKPKAKQIFSGSNKEEKPDPMAYLFDKLNFHRDMLEYIDVNPDDAVKREVMEGLIMCDAMEKDIYLYYFLLKYPGRTIVFVNSIDAVKRIARLLNELGLPAHAFHSHMIQKQRLRTVERFKENERSILISTDVAARGLDVPHVEHVLHYHLPRSADLYVHRSGRTARGVEKGVAMILCAKTESQQLKNMTKKLGKSSKDFHVFDVDKKITNQLADRVELAQEIVKMDAKVSQDSGSDSDPRRRSKQSGDGFGDSALLKQGAADLGLDDSEAEELLASDSESNRKSSSQKSKQLQDDRQNLQRWRADLKKLLSRIVITSATTSRNYITSGLINLGQRMGDGTGHDSFLGGVKTTALEDISKSRKNRNRIAATK
ncbi:P-loop containing nucleoside triphosphate hydrolase protein [Lipomyces arxii]|uniref:P-loop containing nucleoside triphosphate hydrolase protein n=1 Tax=Lipomyces arxii TaxID=56418 RepID=UPI0034CE3816